MISVWTETFQERRQDEENSHLWVKGHIKKLTYEFIQRAGALHALKSAHRIWAKTLLLQLLAFLCKREWISYFTISFFILNPADIDSRIVIKFLQIFYKVKTRCFLD